MSKSISLSRAQWKLLNSQLQKDFPRSTFLIRSRMKDQLGFTTRNHLEWSDEPNFRIRRTTVELDFYDEGKKTMFLLRYSDFISKPKDSVL